VIVFRNLGTTLKRKDKAENKKQSKSYLHHEKDRNSERADGSEVGLEATNGIDTPIEEILNEHLLDVDRR